MAGFNGNNNIDIDKLTLILEENRDLLNDITNRENCKEGAAQIPKLIFDLVSQADQTIEYPSAVEATVESETPSSSSATESNEAKVSSAQEIIHNLPKVWRVLTELLNHQKLKPVELQVSVPNTFVPKTLVFSRNFFFSQFKFYEISNKKLQFFEIDFFFSIFSSLGNEQRRTLLQIR